LINHFNTTDDISYISTNRFKTQLIHILVRRRHEKEHIFFYAGPGPYFMYRVRVIFYILVSDPDFIQIDPVEKLVP